MIMHTPGLVDHRAPTSVWSRPPRDGLLIPRAAVEDPWPGYMLHAGMVLAPQAVNVRTVRSMRPGKHSWDGLPSHRSGELFGSAPGPREQDGSRIKNERHFTWAIPVRADVVVEDESVPVAHKTDRSSGILLVEDNPGDARLIKEMLKETEHHAALFHAVPSLKEARQIPVAHASVATVLLDLNLPDSEGIHTLVAIREAYPDSAIVILTGLDDEELAMKALREGAQSYLTKNELNPSLLSRTLRYSIERQSFISRLREEEQRSAGSRVNERSSWAALEKEKELHALKSHFVSLVSHEFRAPLAVIQGSVDLIDQYAAGLHVTRIQAHVSRIQMKVRELTALLDDVLDKEKREQRALTCAPTELDIVTLCEELLTDMRALSRSGQQLAYEHVDHARIVLLDHQMVKNALTNLFTNALKYSPPGSTITLRTWLENGRLKLSVQDAGVGIPQEEQGLLFERFFRGSNVSGSEGTGLGLSIAKQYIEGMGGHITFTSVPGKTVFTVELPRRMVS